MDWLEHLDPGLFLLFTLVLTRVSGLVATAPIFSMPEVPVRVRARLAVALALVITPTQDALPPDHVATTVHYAVLVGSELVIGVGLGLGVAILFTGVHLAGQMVGRISGLMLADVFDPNTGESVPQFAKLLSLVVLAVFVTMGGHRMVMAGLLDTFQTIPLGSAGIPVSLADTLVLLVSESFVLGVRASAPIVTAVLLSTLVLGLISRTLPQLNILAMGFGLNSLIVFGALGLTVGAVAWVFQDQLEPAIRVLLEALETPLQSHWFM